MGITYNEANKSFHLQSKNTSYIMQVFKSGYLCHVYWGKKITGINRMKMFAYKDRAFSPYPDLNDKTFSLDTIPMEYPCSGNSDFRIPAYQIKMQNGSTIADSRYCSHKIYKGKPKLNGLPAVYAEKDIEAETLELELFDEVSKLRIILIYTVFEEYDLITRSIKFANEGSERIQLLRALSMNVDFADNKFDMLHLAGAWAKERMIERKPLEIGTYIIDSKRGTSSHQHNPFIALLRKNTDEHNGEVYGFNLVYSGNFCAQVEVDQFCTTRVSMGINPFNFTWVLERGQDFQTPEVVMVYSDKGLNGMSQIYHKLYRERLCRGKYRDEERPILINNWEATYFDFNHNKIMDIAKEASKIGIELFVLDDGWFGKRNDDKCALGDWVVNKEKLPKGLKGLAESINQEGMRFGLWVEPEMISPDSDLYRKHPDWCLHVPNRTSSEGRNQLVLDLSRKDVCDEIISMLKKVFSSANIQYVKWDMNRHLTEVASILLPPERQGETAHRYMLGLYRIMDELTKAFQDVLFEGCSGGGGRFDPGILYYMPQIWTSDNTDAVDRLKIQYGTSIVYPPSTMGAHVSASPNHYTRRSTSVKFRGDVAMAGNFGYELDLTELSKEDKENMKKQVEEYKKIRRLVQYGDFYRLSSPFKEEDTAWMIISQDKKEFILYYYYGLKNFNGTFKNIRLVGLNPEFEYKREDNQEVYRGDELMYFGLNLPQSDRDFFSLLYKFKV